MLRPTLLVKMPVKAKAPSNGDLRGVMRRVTPHQITIKKMFKFSIKGNHENENGNPLPKARYTFRQQRSEGAQRYHEYLDHVRGQFLDELEKNKRISAYHKFILQHVEYSGRKPLHTGDKKCRMRIFITWGSKHHGDPENIFGAIADALFEQDEYLAGEFDFDPIVRKSGRVDVEIEIGSA